MSKGPKADKAVFDSVIDDDNLDFMTYMAEANQTDLTEIERTGCLSVGRDLKNNPLITMIPSMALGVADKPEAMFRKMLLLFLVKANEMVGTAYSVVYAHTTYDVMSQYPLIYRFYSILPRSYKKNIQKMYIIHPNVGIRMFFEFARIFLSQKFYSKLTLCETILDFQKVIPPTLVVIPLKFLRREDEERGLRYCNQMPPLSRSFDPSLGTTRCLDVCMDYLRASGGVRAQGIFRIPGDEAELQLAKVRLQYACTGPAGPRICLSESRAAVIVGDIDSLYDTSTSPVSGSGSLKRGASSPKLSASLPAPSSTELPEEVPMCIAALTNMHTVAQVMKMSIRDLPEALVPEKTFADLVNITRRYDLQKLSIDWEAAVAAKLSTMPLEHLSTFVSVINFLREVWGHSATNSMDAHNLSIVFAPTIFRSEVTDPIRAVMEVKLSQVLLEAVVTKHNILFYAIDLFKQSNPPGRAIPKVLAEYKLDEAQLAADKSSELQDISSIATNIKSSRMMDRMGNNRRKSVRMDAEEVPVPVSVPVPSSPVQEVDVEELEDGFAPPVPPPRPGSMRPVSVRPASMRPMSMRPNSNASGSSSLDGLEEALMERASFMINERDK